MTAVPVRRKESSAPYVAHQKRPPFAQIKRPTTWKEKVVVVKDCAVWWWIALPEQKWVKISECHRPTATSFSLRSTNRRKWCSVWRPARVRATNLRTGSERTLSPGLAVDNGAADRLESPDTSPKG